MPRATTLPPTLASLEPMLLDERPLDLEEPGWLFEIKFEGYRLMAASGEGSCLPKTKSGTDATRWFSEITESLAKVPGGPHIVDGEVCVLDEMGRSDFHGVQARARKRRFVPPYVSYCVFDPLLLDGQP